MPAINRDKWSFTASYKNSAGEEIIFGSNSGVILDNVNSELWNYSWNYNTVSNRISSTSRTVREIPISFLFVGEAETRNTFLDIVDYDVREGELGTLTVNGYEIRGYFIGSENVDHWFVKGVMRRNMKFLTESKNWYKPVTSEFYPQVSDEESQTGKGYEFDYNFDYGVPASDTSIINVESRHAVDFRMVIYGAATNPTILIGGHTYQVNTIVEPSGYLVIDSQRKTILNVGAQGTITNVFNKQNKSSYIFQKIPRGSSEVAWVGEDNSFGFSLTVFNERSEPIWT